jgi:hypothetical protein
MGSVGSHGGVLPRVYFAVVGDTRPAIEDDTAGYPTATVTAIYEAVQALEPRPPPFVVSTGDYVFASRPTGGQAGQAEPQLDLYLGARAKYSGAFFPALGNHECTGATASNCGTGTADGVTANYAAFLRKMLAPIGRTLPYYEVDLTGADASWTAKVVFVAANAWSAAQGTWLESALARPTTYTFVVRHEPASAGTAPGVEPSEAILARRPYTLVIVGHTHSYAHSPDAPREVLVGNGGAPLTSKEYGFAVFDQQADGTIAVDMIRLRTGDADPAFHFAVHPDGTPAP